MKFALLILILAFSSASALAQSSRPFIGQAFRQSETGLEPLAWKFSEIKERQDPKGGSQFQFDITIAEGGIKSVALPEGETLVEIRGASDGAQVLQVGTRNLMQVMTLVYRDGQTENVQFEIAPATESSSADTSESIRTTKTKTDTIPMSFDAKDTGLIFRSPLFEYDLASKQGQSLKMGSLELSERSFQIHYRAPKEFSPAFRPLDASSERRLYLFFPESLFPTGLLEIIDEKTGAVLFEHEWAEKELKKWRETTGERSAEVRKRKVSQQVLNSVYLRSTLGDLELKKSLLDQMKGNVRFCLSRKVGAEGSRMCSPLMRFVKEKTGVRLGRVKAQAEPQVEVMNAPGELKGSVEVSFEMPVYFFAVLKSGMTYEFQSSASNVEFADLATSRKADELTITTVDIRPLGPSREVRAEQISRLVKLLGFEATIGDKRRYWSTRVLRSEPALYFVGKAGGVFKHPFALGSIPASEARVHLHKDSPKGTYLPVVQLKGRKLPDSIVTTDQSSLEVDPKDPTLLVWNFKAVEPQVINRSYLQMGYKGRTYRSFYEIYRGLGNELSSRMTGFYSGGQILSMWELAYQRWFESAFGWDSALFSKQRWGFSGKYFQALTKLPLDETRSVGLNAMTLDLKYRMTPGIWTRDESHGLMLSNQIIQIDDIRIPMLGFGWFWARSMPRVFDDLFNLVPIMRYPKWVDMELVYFPVSMDSAFKLNPTFSANFHGQVLWSADVYGEAGFGWKRYDFVGDRAGRTGTFDIFYGTVGLGVKY